MTGQTENKYFTEPPNYTEVQQNKQVLIAAEAVLTQTLTIMYRYTDTQTANTVVNASLPDTDYLYYPLDVEGITLKGVLLPASIQ